MVSWIPIPYMNRIVWKVCIGKVSVKNHGMSIDIYTPPQSQPYKGLNQNYSKAL